MDAQKVLARAAEINAELEKRGVNEVIGADRRALADELTTLLTGPAASPAAIDPQKQRRLDEITATLRDQAATSDPTKRMTAIERTELAREASDILLGADSGGAAGGDGGGAA
jgi:hypothetical protein